MIRRAVTALAAAAAAVTLGGLALAEPAAAHHGTYVTHPEYRGVRWMSTKMCVEDRTGYRYGTSQYANISRAVQSVSDRTALTIWLKRGIGSCGGFVQRIILVKGNYGPTWLAIADTMPACSSTRTTGCRRWAKTAAGHWTYLWNGYNTVRLNTYYGSQAFGKGVIEHELGHAAGALGHADTCNSLMSMRAGCNPGYTTPWDARNVGAIYMQ